MFAGESKVINLVPGHRNWKRLGQNHLYPLHPILGCQKDEIWYSIL